MLHSSNHRLGWGLSGQDFSFQPGTESSAGREKARCGGFYGPVVATQGTEVEILASLSFRGDDLQFLTTPVENLFIDEFMARAPGEFVKVYLCGLRLCLYPPPGGVDLSTIARHLDMDEAMLTAAFSYWERQGLVEIVERNPLSVRYLQIQQQFQRGLMNDAVYPYRDLNNRLQNLFGERLLNNDDYTRVYDWIETLGLSEDAVLMLAQHCIDKAGRRVSFAYMDKTARTWAEKGLTTPEAAREYLERYDETYGGARQILRRWNLRRPPTEEEMALYRKWVRDWNLEPGAVIEACSRMAGVSNPNFLYLDKTLQGLFEQRVHTAEEAVEVLEKRSQTTRSLGAILRELGYQGSASAPELQAMYRRWREDGFSDRTLKRAARQLAREGRNQPQHLNSVLNRWSQWGMVSDQAVSDYLDRLDQAGEAVGELLAGWGEARAATGSEKKAWLDMIDEGYTPELIAAAAQQATGASHRFAYMRRVLAAWRQAGITTAQEALDADKKRARAPAGDFHYQGERVYTDQEMEAWYEDLSEP